MGNLGTTCPSGHDLTLPNAVYYNKNKAGNKFRRCRACWQTYQRNLRRVKLGVPLDAPVRAYKPQVRKPQETRELIKLVSNNPELAEYLLRLVRELQDN